MFTVLELLKVNDFYICFFKDKKLRGHLSKHVILVNTCQQILSRIALAKVFLCIIEKEVELAKIITNNITLQHHNVAEVYP